MALTDRAVVLACSVSLLAITLAAIYYWQSSSSSSPSSSKNRKNSKKSKQSVVDDDKHSEQQPKQTTTTTTIISVNNNYQTQQDHHQQQQHQPKNIVEQQSVQTFDSNHHSNIDKHLDDNNKIPCSSSSPISVDIGNSIDNSNNKDQIQQQQQPEFYDKDLIKIIESIKNDDNDAEEEDLNLNNDSVSSTSLSFTSIDEDEYTAKKMHLKNYSFNTAINADDHENSSNFSIFKNCSPKSTSSSSSADNTKEIIMIDDDDTVRSVLKTTDEIDGGGVQNKINNNDDDDDANDDGKQIIKSKNDIDDDNETIKSCSEIDSLTQDNNDNVDKYNNDDDEINQKSSTVANNKLNEPKSNDDDIDDDNNQNELNNATNSNNDKNIESIDKKNVSSSEESDNDLDTIIDDNDGDGCNLPVSHIDDSATNHQSKDDSNGNKKMPPLMMATTTTTTTVNTSSNLMAKMSAFDDDQTDNKKMCDHNKDTNSIGQQQRQTFAQIVLSSSSSSTATITSTNNCDSKTMVVDKNDHQQNDFQQNCESKIIAENVENANNDNHSKSAKIDDYTDDPSQQLSIKDENDDTDIYQNYPDLSLTPNSDDQQQQQQQQQQRDQQQVTDPNSSNNSCDDQSQESNDSGKGSCLLETTTIDPSSTSATTVPINDKITEAMAAAENSWYPSTTTINDNVAYPPMPSIFDTIPMDSQHCIQYNFRIPTDLCGFLIGRKGRFINPIKLSTNTQIIIEPYNGTTNICTIYGPRPNVFQALNLIKTRFPVETYPNVDYNHFPITPTVALTASCQLSLPVGVMTEVVLSCTIDASHFYLQQPTHPSYPMLSTMDHEMKENYSNGDTPPIPQVKEGLVCAAPTAEGWYRASVKYVHESRQECDLTFIDYGGEALNVPVDTLRAIHCHFLRLPFQASECRLSRVIPIDVETGWTAQANACFEELAKGQVIYAFIENFDETGIPCVNLYKNGENKTWIDIADELVNRGHAQYIINTPSSTTMTTTINKTPSSSNLASHSSMQQPYWPSSGH
ncbi:uncharacterized protein LOC124496702 isoform X1 [Dermatophagoides farinae]|uniref:uncharacterized protein LOC124496702 isoform X1 n=1 Tax=Dermatophagoides farinae TaxID=6954 RepID=UPI003F5ECED3